jgi:hypothetical protein
MLCLSFVLPSQHYWSQKTLSGMVILLSLSTLILNLPIAGHTLHDYLYGWFGNCSIITLIVLASIRIHRSLGLSVAHKQDIPALSLLTLITALCFYPAALGYTEIDPYAWGYNIHWFKALIMGLSLLFTVSHLYLSGMALMLALLAYELRLLESSNLWDYLIDPVYALVILLFICLRVLQKTFQLTKHKRA